jgi:Trypsin
MGSVGRRLVISIAVLAAAACALASAAGASALPERVKVGPDLYLQSAETATEVDRRRSGRSAPPSPALGTSGRIVGGAPTTIASYPWQVALAYNDALFAGNGFQRQFCGGTLVAPNVVMTAAHCVYDNPDPVGFNAAANFESFTGRTTLSTAEGQVIDWAAYYFFTDGAGNPLFDPVTFDYDAIFVVLAGPSSSPPIKVAGADEAATWAAGRRAWISGWGDTASGAGDFQDTLRAAQVQIIGDDVCSNPASYGSDFHPQLMLCAGIPTTGGVDSCQGDSGGPIVVPVVGGNARATGSWRLVGDTSWGIGCAAPQYPGVYGRIAGGTTMGNALQTGIQSITGQNVYGSGAQPAEPPQVAITKRPKNKTKTKPGKKKAKVKYTFTSAPGSDFTCQLDTKPPGLCSSPYTKRLKKGKHTVTIVATNFLGEAGAPVTDKFKVQRKKKKRRR